MSVDDRPRVRRARSTSRGHRNIICSRTVRYPLMDSYVTQLFTLFVDNVTWEGRGWMLAEGLHGIHGITFIDLSSLLIPPVNCKITASAGFTVLGASGLRRWTTSRPRRRSWRTTRARRYGRSTPSAWWDWSVQQQHDSSLVFGDPL
jgi:hypothetical protein